MFSQRQSPRIHQTVRAGLIVLMGVALIGPMVSEAAEAVSYHLEKVVTIPSSDTGWDYNSLDQKRGHMFIAHRKDGLHVYDVKSGKMIKTMQDSSDANTSALAPEFDLGVAGTTDGHVVVFRLSTLKTLSRSKSDTGGFDGATFDNVNKRFALVGDADGEKKTTPVFFSTAKQRKRLARFWWVA